MASTLLLPEAQPRGVKKSTPPKADMDDLERAITAWRETPTAGHLGDVLSFSIASDCVEAVRDIAREALSEDGITTLPQRALMKSLVATSSIEEDATSGEHGICNPHVQRQVQEVRALLRTNPVNPLVLLDFAQLQLAVGKPKQAERALLSALAISPNSRLILRTLARFRVHAGREAAAHDLIAKHAKTNTDPWLMASEIALSQAAKVPSKFIKKGWKLTKDGRESDADISELAGAIAGVELFNGKSKQARELFRVALIQPNDNVIAQAITDQRILTLDLSQPAQRNVALGASEARTLLSWESLDTAAAEKNALRWHAEEPFSSRPLQFLTALYAIGRNHEGAAILARRGLVADPRDAVLMANLGYSLACMGKLGEAEIAARKAMSLDSNRFEAHTSATRGLIAMTAGNFVRADELYSKALAIFEAKRQTGLSALCYAFYARAAQETGHPRANEIIQRAADLYKESPSIDAALILRQLQSDIDDPPGQEPVRRLGQWVFDAERNLLVRKEGITPVGAPSLVLKAPTPSATPQDRRN